MSENKEEEKGELNRGFEDDVELRERDTNGADLVKNDASTTETDKDYLKPATCASGSSDRRDKNEGRENWSSPIEFLLSCISLSVGLGNVWRFPTTALENGGGAFLIPYIIVLIFIGRPLYYMELCLGQFASYGCTKMWNMAPGLRGVGYGQTIANMSVCIYYVSIMALTVYYFAASFSKTLPWSSCPHNETFCFDSNTNASLVNVSTMMSSSEYYFTEVVTRKHEHGLDDGFSPPILNLTLCLLASWALVFITLVKGVKSSGKVAYFTALFPYLALLILLIRGATLPGAMKGILFFITPQFEKLMEAKVWAAAIGQCFFSLSVGYGSIIMMGSYNSFRHNVYRDATIISVTDTMTSILAGCTTFAIMGYLAEEMGVDDVRDVMKGGGSVLAFVSYPNVLSRFIWVPQLFATVFFLMLLSLGVGSAVGLSNSAITVLADTLPNIPKWKITLGVCIIGFLSGLFYVTPQGPYALILVDFYIGEIAIVLLTIVEVVGVQWVYGLKNFMRDIEFMLNMKTGYYWRLCWGIFTPLGLIFILIFKFLTWDPLKDGSYVFSYNANAFGIVLVVISVGMFPVYFLTSLYAARKKTSSYRSALTTITSPSHSWGPADKEIKDSYTQLVLSTQGIDGKDRGKELHFVRSISFQYGSEGANCKIEDSHSP